MNQWKDISSHSRSDADRTPKTWTMDVGKFNITVTRHIHYPGTWIMRAPGFRSEYDLHTDDADAAKIKAIGLFRNALTNALSEM